MIQLTDEQLNAIRMIAESRPFWQIIAPFAIALIAAWLKLDEKTAAAIYWAVVKLITGDPNAGPAN